VALGRTPNSIRIDSIWIVRLALRWPYTFTVMAILIVLMGIVAITLVTHVGEIVLQVAAET
jgi:hypothetical protein